MVAKSSLVILFVLVIHTAPTVYIALSRDFHGMISPADRRSMSCFSPVLYQPAEPKLGPYNIFDLSVSLFIGYKKVMVGKKDISFEEKTKIMS